MAAPGAPLVDLVPFCSPERVCFLPTGCSKREALELMAERAATCAGIRDSTQFRAALFEREEVSSTGIGQGVAVPHCKLASIDGFTLTLGIAREGVAWQSPDGLPVRVIVMIAASDRERQLYLRLLASVAARLRSQDLVNALATASDGKAAVRAFLAG